MSYLSELPEPENINGYYLPFNYDQSTGTWNDLVGTNHFTQQIVNSRPILKDDIVNNKFKYVLFTSSPLTKMTLPPFITNNANDTDNFTIFTVARRGKDVNSSGIFSTYDTDGRILQDGTHNFLAGWWSNTEGVFFANGWLNSGNKNYEKNWAICVFRRKNGINKSWSMGYTGGNGGPYLASGITRSPQTSGYHTHTGGTAQAINYLKLNDGLYGQEVCDFHLGELLIYKTGLSDSDTESVIDYLERRYFGSDGVSGTGTTISNPITKGILGAPISHIDRNYNSNWVISVDKWDSYRSIGYQGNLDVNPIQAASVIAGGGGFDGSFNVVDASFRTQGDASSNWFSSSHPAQMAFNNDISFIGGQYFKVEYVSAYENGSIVSDSDNSAVKLDFLFPSPRTATEYKILPPNEINIYNANYMPNRWCIYGSSYETIDTSKPSTEENGYFLLDSRADVKPWSAHDASLISVSGGKKYIIANPGLYRQYRMSILQNSGNSNGNINIGELIYYEGGVGPLVGGGALDGRSDLSGGLAFHGDISGVIGHSDGSFVTNIFDGSDNSLYKSPIGTFENYDLSAGKEFAVKFELPSKKKILKYDIKNTNIISWTLRGCDNSAIYDRTDSNTYEVLDTKVDFSYVGRTNSGISSNSGFSNTVDGVLGGDAGLFRLESSITLWIDGANIDGTNNSSYSNGDTITTWKDLSSKGNDLERRNNPTFSDNGGPLGSNKAVVDLTDDAFRTSGNIDINIIFIVHKTKKEDFFFDFRSGNGSYIWTGGDGVDWKVHQNGNNTNSDYDTDYIMNDEWSVTVFDGVTSSYNAKVYLMGRYTDNERGTGQVAEMIMFDTQLTDQEINIIEYYLAVKWNLSNLSSTSDNYDDTGVKYNTSRIISNPKDYTYYVLDVTTSKITDSAELGELIYYDTGSYPSAGAGSLDGSSGHVGGLLIHGDVSGVGGQSHSTSVFNGTLSDASDAFISDSGVFSNNSLASGSEFSVKFEFPTKKYISTYRIWPQFDGSMNSPSDWYLYGCDVSSLYDRADESTYNVLDVRTEENSWPVTSAYSIDDLSGYNEYTIIDPGNYSYYVLDVSASNNASLCSIGELAYYESKRVDVTTIRDPQPYENHQLAINLGASEETSDWEVGEIIVFNKKLTSDEEERVVSYLENTFYGSDGFEPVGNNSNLRLTRNNLRLPEVYSAMDPSGRDIEYFNQSDYNRIVNMNLASINYEDVSNIPIKTSDLRNRVLSTDASFRTITGVSKGYTTSSIVKLSDFRGARGGGYGDGGTLTTAKGYNIHSFTTVGTHTFTVTGSITVEFLIVGGGGGGGMDMGGGGGGGGVVKGIDYILGNGKYIITVGDGGGGAPAANTSYQPGGHQYTINGEDGLDSSIVVGTVDFIGKGGGYGGSSYHYHTLGGKGSHGGSGGGASGYGPNTNGNTITNSIQKEYTGTSGVVGYGNKGGESSGTSHYSSGGGGAGGRGFTAVGTSIYPKGGPGIVSDILGTSYYWAGGGGGSGYSQIGGNGGDGGGGGGAVGNTTGGSGLNPGNSGGGGVVNNQANRPGGNAGANTGGGGGGGSHYNSNNKGGDGGSGIVVIRYK